MEDEKQRSLLTQRVETMASVIELLLETLKDLSDEEFEEFKKVLNQFPFLSPDLLMFVTTDMQSLLLKITDLQDTVFSMVQTFGQKSVEKTKEVLKKMKRTDLVQRLSDSSSGAKKKHSVDEHLSALIHKVATMAAFKELLLETFSDLSYKDLNTYKWLLQFTLFKRNLPQLSWEQLWANSVNLLVDVMVEKYGQQSVEVTKEVFMDMNRMDLVQRLSETSSGHKEKHSVDEHWPVLTQKVETMASVIELLLETLKDLTYGEVKEFKLVLSHVRFQLFRLGKWSLLETTGYSLRLLETMGLQDTVFLLVQTFGQRSVEKTKEVLKKMNMTDLDQRLSDSSSGSEKKPSTDEQRSALIQKVATIAAVKQLLLETLKDLSNEELKKFEEFLQLIFSQKDLQMDLRDTADRAEIVDLMVETYGQQSVELTREVFMDLNRTDLVQRLSKPSSGLKEKPSVDKRRTALLERVSARAAVRKILFETLSGLNMKELMEFKFLLQFKYFQKSLPQISKRQMLFAHSAEELVDLMVENLLKIRQPVEVTKEVFMDMNRTDLVQRLSETSSGLKEGPSRSLVLKGCGSSMQDSSDWTKLEPDVNSTDADEAPAYSLQTEAGKFECSVSGLRWFCKEKISFKYQFCSWEEPMERMESIQYMPAGPLIDITVIAGRLDEVYLPHWICIDDNPAILDKFAVLHINDSGDVVEKVSEVTQSHVKLSEPVFSPRAVLMKIGFPLKISCNVLIYYKPNTTFLKLHVYLIPHDLALKKRVDKKESSKGYQLIEKPRPDKYLKMKQGFKLAADIDTARICPKEITLRYDSQEPNFYEVVSENPDGDFHLILSHTNKSDPVWTCEIQKDDDLRYQNSPHLQVQETGGQSSLPGSSDKKHTVNEHLSALMQNATITTDRERLWYVLGRLKRKSSKNSSGSCRTGTSWQASHASKASGWRRENC
ncbi:uncharacterized protein LOC127366633 isoform X1 [Dicentrarchus labrax]|nr:uncharacterized protein LOC127366633 isoform X1 [Dicentrarchus labrax]XP_051261724.1 uncharacterized protein LOC127366633 isoform X1 [Dicentrarchus labrax]XP_051261725.1 uncharacterized protein LOC127366633 isoform X1 [Dicentrarchus labrax]